nr:immunoglobulin heavy chain junction region [Mus musculus]MBK4184629.1 immunoglobulin heavy chain junction region [Mus musculus]MBK4184630.1 immunoglobulin heavy chain junction region [Mus musculus]
CARGAIYYYGSSLYFDYW